MNLTNFLKQTDALAVKYSKEQLIAFIHDMGRVLSEDDREDFLKRLKAIGEETEEAQDKSKKNNSDFQKMYWQVRDNLKRIDSQEIVIEGFLNEAYDDWYHDDEEEFYYEDNSGVSHMLLEACDFVHTSVDTERYTEGFKVGRQLCSMEILCMNEYGDEEFSLGDMVYHELLDCSVKEVLLDTLYCAYHAVPLEERSKALYEVIESARWNEITLEAMMQHGDEELPDFPEFLPLWIAYLGSKAGRDADRLASEAIGLLNDFSLAAAYAEQFADIHPGLYLNLLEDGKAADVNKLVSLGITAMKMIPRQYVMRSRVALKTAEYVKKAKGKEALLEMCYFAAYESDTCPLNYIRAFLNGYGTKEKREQLREVFIRLSAHKGDGPYGMFGGSESCSERKENSPDSNKILVLRFLDGQFGEVLTKGLNKSEALGWSGTFMKDGIALYLLYLHEGKWMGQGMKAMLERAKNAMGFSAEEYRKGLSECYDLEENALLYALFSKWKSIVEMEPDVRNRAIRKIKSLIEKRTAGIMDANRRNYYWECAAYIAALGEVQESLGESDAKQKLMMSYKDKYPRRSAFRAEMREYGWLDMKSK